MFVICFTEQREPDSCAKTPLKDYSTNTIKIKNILAGIMKFIMTPATQSRTMPKQFIRVYK